jgi:hypothetical protein
MGFGSVIGFTTSNYSAISNTHPAVHYSMYWVFVICFVFTSRCLVTGPNNVASFRAHVLTCWRLSDFFLRCIMADTIELMEITIVCMKLLARLFHLCILRNWLLGHSVNTWINEELRYVKRREKVSVKVLLSICFHGCSKFGLFYHEDGGNMFLRNLC